MKEETLFNFIYSIYDRIYGVFLFIKYGWWVYMHPEAEKEARKLHKRVVNELLSYGIELPTKFQLDKYGICAYHFEDTDLIRFPLAYMNPKFRAHGDSAIGYIRHEYGHACMYHYYEQVGAAEFNKLFGNMHTPYHYWRFICWKKRQLDWKNYITKYAQVHSVEDVAECFFVYLQKKGDVEYLKKNRPAVYKKMMFVKKVLKTLSKIDLLNYPD